MLYGRFMRAKKRLYHPVDETEEPTLLWQKLFDLDEIESLMQSTAREGKPISYSEALDMLGFKFSRPKMRALCVALGEVDRRAREKGEPELAVLLVRASDKIPGQGWWVDRNDLKYKGPWEGQKAEKYVRAIQKKAFEYWRNKVD